MGQYLNHSKGCCYGNCRNPFLTSQAFHAALLQLLVFAVTSDHFRTHERALHTGPVYWGRTCIHSYHAFPQVKCKSCVRRAFIYKGACGFDLWWGNDEANFKRCHCHYWSAWSLTADLCYLNICQAWTEAHPGICKIKENGSVEK